MESINMKDNGRMIFQKEQEIKNLKMVILMKGTSLKVRNTEKESTLGKMESIKNIRDSSNLIKCVETELLEVKMVLSGQVNLPSA